MKSILIVLQFSISIVLITGKMILLMGSWSAGKGFRIVVISSLVQPMQSPDYMRYKKQGFGPVDN